MKLRLVVLLAAGVCALRAQPAATLLGDKIAAVAGDGGALKEAVVLAAAEPDSAETVSEAAEVARLERLPAIPIPIQDETLAAAITVIASAAGMNFIAPAADDFPERITLTTKVSPWRLLNRLGERYRFSMACREGIWEFNREAAGAVVARVYFLKHTNLDIYRASQNSFSTVGSISPVSSGESQGTQGGMVFSAQTQKIIEDIRDLIGLPSSKIVGDASPAGGGQSEVGATKPAGPASDNGNAAKVIYIPDVNALYVACSRVQHDLVAGYIRLIDQPPRQVHIEARFFETSWDPKAVLGINPQNFQPKVALTNIEAGVNLSRFSTENERAVLTVDDLALQMNALRSDSRSRLVQNPTVITANNHEVYFSVGDEEPFVSSNNIYTGVANAGFGSTTASVSIRRIGTSVNVVPTIFDGEDGGKRRIRLVVRIEVGALKGFRQVNAINIPVVTSQKYEYTTYVEDNQVLAFGGLSGIGESDGVTKVPVAGDVPVVGYLFKSKSREIHQRNLVAYIIARVVSEPEKAELPSMTLRDPDKAARKGVFPE
jgi:type II secretory pathway component GspD/PulD (secretin)